MALGKAARRRDARGGGIASGAWPRHSSEDTDRLKESEKLGERARRIRTTARARCIREAGLARHASRCHNIYRNVSACVHNGTNISLQGIITGFSFRLRRRNLHSAGMDVPPLPHTHTHWCAIQTEQIESILLPGAPQIGADRLTGRQCVGTPVQPNPSASLLVLFAINIRPNE